MVDRERGTQLNELCFIDGVWCLTRSEWISLWSGLAGGFGGALFGFVAATAYQALTRRRAQRSARSKIAAAIERFRDAIADPEQIAEAPKKVAFAIVDARAGIGWAVGHPEYFTFDEWTDFHELGEVIEIWFSRHDHIPDFRDSVYSGQIDGAYLVSLSQRVQDLTVQE